MRKLHAALLFENYAQSKWLHLGYVPFECLDEVCAEIHENLQIGANRDTKLIWAIKSWFNHLIPVARTNELSCWIVPPIQQWDYIKIFSLFLRFNLFLNFYFILESQTVQPIWNQTYLNKWSPHQFYHTILFLTHFFLFLFLWMNFRIHF